MRIASSTIYRAVVGLIDQPTTLREYNSTTTARYNQPCLVRIKVMSVTRATSGWAKVKGVRCHDRGAIGNPHWRLVTPQGLDVVDPHEARMSPSRR